MNLRDYITWTGLIKSVEGLISKIWFPKEGILLNDRNSKILPALPVSTPPYRFQTQDNDVNSCLSF